MASLFAASVERISLKIRLLQKSLTAAAGMALRTTLERVARQERVLLSMGWHPAGTRTGSAPGQPPWRVSGHMSRQVKVYGPIFIGGWRPRWEGKVGPDVVQGRIQELGGWAGAGHRSYLPPRPSLGPAWRIVKPGVRVVFEHDLRRGMKV